MRTRGAVDLERSLRKAQRNNNSLAQDACQNFKNLHVSNAERPQAATKQKNILPADYTDNADKIKCYKKILTQFKEIRC